MRLGDLIRRNARFLPDKPAFVMGERCVTFRDYDRRVNRLVNALRGLGLAEGDRLAFLARNSLECLDVFGAGEKGGYPVAPLNFRLAPRELEEVLDRVEPRALFVQERFLETAEAAGCDDALRVVLDGPAQPGWRSLEELLRDASDAEPEAPRVDPEDVCYLMSTSGTTGRPRAAMLTHRGQWLDAAALALEMRLSPSDRHLATMPLFHVGGHAIVLAHTLRGCTVHLQESFDAAAVARTVEAERITTTQIVPTMLGWLLDEAPAEADLSSLRLVWYASAPMPVELLRRGLARFGSIFLQGYGQTECGPLATTLLPEEHVVDGPGAERLASCGRAVPGVEVEIVEADADGVGEIAIRSPFTMVGYWREPELTAERIVDGWLRTGDLARMDELGYVYIVDRKHDLIISGGENVYPREVEEVIYAHPAVLEAAVVGIPHETWGETPAAVVVRRAGAALSQEELIAFCRERLARYKCPRTVEFRDELPKSPSGKVLRRLLREQLGEVVAR